jgi:two-component sensor histidine kinase
VVLDAKLVVSELVANAVRHAPGPCGLLLQLTSEELVIAVWDASGEEPVFKKPDRHRIGGHGLHLVRAASTKVTVTPCAQGKQVTAHLRLEAHVNESHHADHRTALRFPALGQNTAGGLARQPAAPHLPAPARDSLR